MLLRYLVVILIALCAACTSANYTGIALADGKKSFKAGNYTQAYHQLLPLAAKGNPDAQYAIGYMYYYGKGVDQNRQIAIHWMKKAAAQGQQSAVQALSAMS